MGATGRAVYGVLLKRYRKAAGLTQEALAARAGYSAVYISMLERGQRQPLPATAQLLATALDLPAHDHDLLLTAARGQSASSSHAPVWPPSPQPLIGRERELASIEAHLVGTGPLVLALAGEPGIGKTRLLQEAAERGAAYGWRALHGSCQRRGGQEPYAPLLGAIEQHVREQEPERLRAALQGCAWLARLLPELAEILEQPAPGLLPPAQERRLMFGAVVRYLTKVAGPAGTLLILDDVQWAGQDALDLLVSLIQAVPAGAIRVVVAYRDTEVTTHDLLSVMLADLAGAGLLTRQALGPLPEDAATRLLDGVLRGAEGTKGAEDKERALRDSIVRRAGGVPFFLISCAQGWRADASVGSPAGQAQLPWNLAQSLRQRVAALPETAQRIMDVAAVAGRYVRSDILAAVAALPENTVLAALEEACRARLLAEDGAEGYRFAHDVVREVVEADLGVTRRAALHRRVAEALEQGARACPAETLAYHYGRGGDQDKAALYLEQAGERAREQSAHTAAVGYYGELVERLDGLDRPARAARAREQLGAALTTLSRFDEALAVLEQAAAAYDTTGDHEGLGRVMARIGWIHSDRGTTEEGVRRLRPVLDVLVTSNATHGLAALYAALAQLYSRSDRADEHMAAAARAAELARALGDDQILAIAEGGRGSALLVQGRFAEGLPALEAAVRAAESVGDLTTLSRGLNNVATLHFFAGEFKRAAPYRVRALAVAERLGDPAYLAFMIASQGQLAFFSGDWATARLNCEQAVAMARQTEADWISMFLLLILGELRMAEGLWDEAVRYLEEGVTFATRSNDLRMLRWITGMLAERDLLAGQPEAAHARLLPLLDRPGMQEWYVNILLPRLAWSLLEQGDVAAAAEMAGQGVERARTQHNRFTLVDALRVQAMVWARQRRWDDAAGALEDGLALARRMPYPYAEARLLHVYGMMCVEQGGPEPARQRLAAALAIFERLGARKDTARTRETLTLAGQSWMRRADAVVTDAQWAAIAALLPPLAHTGRRRADDRRTLEAILYVRRTGCAWSDLPAALGDDATAHRRLAEWRAAGLWERIEAILETTAG